MKDQGAGGQILRLKTKEDKFKNDKNNQIKTGSNFAEHVPKLKKGATNRGPLTEKHGSE